jgi:hypothetical protein
MLRFLLVSIFKVLLILLFMSYIIVNIYNSKFIINEKTEPILQSFVASGIFIVFVFILLKPSLIISNKIAKSPTGIDEKGIAKGHVLVFKVVNISFFSANDLKILLYKSEQTTQAGNHISRSLIANIDGSSIGCQSLQSGIKGLFDPYKLNCMQITTNKSYPDNDIMQILSNNSYLELHIIAKNSLSGLQSSFIKKYDNINCVKVGHFISGFSTSIES